MVKKQKEDQKEKKPEGEDATSQTVKGEAVKGETAKGKEAANEAKSGATACTDKFCPFHGSSKLHGRILKATVIRAKAHKTVTVDKLRLFYISKYERYEKRHTKVLAHNPPCINAKLDDEVRIMETRPLSKTKHFIVIEVLSKK